MYPTYGLYNSILQKFTYSFLCSGQRRIEHVVLRAFVFINAVWYVNRHALCFVDRHCVHGLEMVSELEFNVYFYVITG